MKNTGEESWKQIVREKQSSKESCEEEKKKKKPNNSDASLFNTLPLI